MYTRTFKLCLNAGTGSAPFINVSQTDRDEVWLFELYTETGERYIPSSGAIIGIKADGHGISNTGTVDNEGRVVITETEQMTAAAGRAIFELSIDGLTHGTANFIVNVEKKPIDGAIMSDSDLSLISEAVDSVAKIEDLLGGQDVPTVITPIISDWLDENITNPSNPPIDTSLTVTGAAADAKATGDEIDDLNSALTDIESALHVTNTDVLTWENGNINSSGENTDTSASTRLRTPGYYPCPNGFAFTVPTGFKAYVRYFDTETPSSSATSGGWLTGNVSIDDFDGNYIRVILAKSDDTSISPSDITTPITITLHAMTDKTLSDDFKAADAKTTGAKLKNVNDKVKLYRETHTVVYDKNLYNASCLTAGQWVNGNGDMANSPTSYYADVPVYGGQNISICFGINIYMASSNVGGLIELDENKNKIGVKDFGTIRLSDDKKYNDYYVGSFMLNSGTRFIRFTAKLSSTWDARETIIVTYGQDLTDYTGDGSTISLWDGLNFDKAAWHGKKWCVIGDSISAVNNTASKKYHTLISEMTGIDIVNLAVSGSGYAKKAESNEAFLNQAGNITADCDLVTVFGSGNDNTSGLDIGTKTDTGTTTLCGCVNTLIDYMIANHPTVAFGIITPTPWENWEPSDNLYWMREYSQAIVDICARRGVPCLDLYHCSNLHPSNSAFNALAFYNADGTHPNNIGQAIIVPRIKAFVETLLM